MISTANRKPSPAFVLAASLVLVLLVAPVALAGSSGGPRATASASVKKKINNLTQRLAELEQEVDSSQGAPAPPSGQAGGGLSGSYPNPSIGSNVVGSGQVIANSLGGADIAEGALDPGVVQRRVTDNCPAGESIRAIDASGANVTCETVGGGGNPTGAAGGDLAGSSYPNPELAADAVGSPEVAPDSLAAGDLGADSAGASEIAPNSIGNSKIVDNGVIAADLAPDSVTSSEVAASAVGSSEVVDNGLIANDLAIDSVTSSEIATSAVGSIEVASNSLDSTDINEANLQGVGSANALENGADDLTPGELGAINHTNLPNCNPGSAAFVSCGTATTTAPATGTVLVLAHGGFVGTDSGADAGICKIMEGTTQVGQEFHWGQSGNEHNSGSHLDGFTLSGADIVSAGSHTWQLQCNETEGNAQVNEAGISAIYVF